MYLIFPEGKSIDFIIMSDEFVKTIDYNDSNGEEGSFTFWK